MWTFKSKFAAWALRLAPALRVELRLADLESAELTVTQSRNIYTRQFNKVSSYEPKTYDYL